MKIFLFFSIISCSTFIISCNKTKFTETKIAVVTPSSVEQTVPQEMPATTSSQELPPGHPPTNGESDPIKMPSQKIKNLQKVGGGITIEECFKNKNKLNGKTIILRGKVVKFNSGILNKNWLHIQDGSGVKGKNDLVVTTSDVAQINDIVVVTGAIHYDKDIGSGYFFPVIIEDAKIKIEK